MRVEGTVVATVETRLTGALVDISAVPAVVTLSGSISLLLSPAEARALSRALETASRQAERTAEPSRPSCEHLWQSVGDWDSAGRRLEVCAHCNRERTTQIAPGMCDRCVDLIHPRRDCAACAAEARS